MVRFRPCNEKEISVSSEMSVNFLDNHQIEFISTIENSKYNFSFDRIFSPKSSQSEIFDITARPILNSILEGFNGTILAYGQTASGKTFTMQGDLDVPELEGIIPRTISMLFESIVNSPEEVEFTVKTSMVEIYMEKIRDLIDVSRVNLSIREDKARGIYIEDISEYYVSSKEEIMELIRIGSENRIQASTNMNENSSRSHSIFIINVHQLNGKDGSAKNSKLVLVDLAGSEKISKTGATGLTLEEAKTINKSLTTLGMVINSLTDGKSSHIPYRESKLTRVLQESLGGNSKTCLIVTCSPSIYNEAESLSTLRFGNRAKNIRNKPKINKELTVAELQVTIDSLEKKLVIANERIKLLERYIESKGLKLPKDNFSQVVGSFKELNDIEKTIKQADEALNTNIDDLDEKLLKQDINLSTDNQIEKPNDYYECDSTQISNYNKITEDGSNLLAEQKIKDELDKKMKIQDLEDFNKQIEEERKLSSEQQKVIAELREIIKDNDEFLNKIKENEKILNFNNEKIKSQIMEIKSGISLNYISSTITNCKKENIQDSNKIIADLLKSRKVENINTKYQIEIEELRKELKKSENEKKFILKALEEKSEKIAQQEIEIKEFMEMVKILENKISPEDRNFAKKLIGLEKNLEQMNSMYQQIVTQKGVVKCENQILNKKIKQRNDRIILLEKEISELKDAVSLFILIIYFY